MQHLSLKQKLGVLAALLALLFCVGGGVGALAVWREHGKSDELQGLRQSGLETVVRAARTVSAFERQSAAFRDLLLPGQEPAALDRARKALADEAKNVGAELRALARTAEAFGVPRARVDAIVRDHEALSAQLRDALAAYEAAPSAAMALNAERVVHRPHRQVAAALGELEPAIAAGVAASAQQLAAEGDATHRAIVAFIVVSTLIGVALFAIAFWWIIRMLLRDLGGEPAEVTAAARAIAAGDLSTELAVAPGDTTSLAAAFVEMQGRLRGMIGDLNDSVAQLVHAATDLSTSSTQISTGVENGSEATSSMAASIEELTVSIDQVAKHSADALRMSRESGELSNRGAEVVGRTATDMTEIANSAQELVGIISQLGDRSSQISRVVTVIQDIANQTNLLALNAAIEAARAGEQGRGFSVVADEVRKLAERTSASTHEITQMVEAIQSGTQRAVEYMESWGTRVSDGVSSAQDAGACMGSVQNGAGEVVRVVTDISSALSEQSAASNQIAQNVERIAQMSDESAAALRAVVAAAQSLDGLAARLAGMVRSFRTAAPV